ncbi:hypothetical protein IE81DRAFT_39008 [Ceraceosorus guamensis]|uniref:Uncharacterized protein n=1 Tax=Ceraceosorus guamensis TaxID=1522189 RepID=A0A316W943_9BASI|nr:hypothetical protein IE81DRAFT_39008 [Ceraceosorus guamensis]PWN44235.1 hypothetical protein IE81DRAFT_39008 [Ceraceosorus guamensis]
MSQAGARLMGTLPVKDAFCGLSPRTIALLITPLLVMVTAVEAAWDAYVLAEFSDGLSTFRKILAGLQVALLAILIVLFVAAYFVGIIPRKNKVVKFLAHIALLKGLALGLVGIIHIISVVKNKDEFHDDCVKKNTEDFCSERLTRTAERHQHRVRRRPHAPSRIAVVHRRACSELARKADRSGQGVRRSLQICASVSPLLATSVRWLVRMRAADSLARDPEPTCRGTFVDSILLFVTSGQIIHIPDI